MEKILIIREADFEDKEEALDRIAAELGFPEYFGRNLDALYDCLCDLEAILSASSEAVKVSSPSSISVRLSFQRSYSRSKSARKISSLV